MIKPSASIFASGVALLATITTVACGFQSTSEQDSQQGISTSGWELVGQLPRPLESHQTVVLNDIVYLLGGWNDTRGPYAEVFFAPLSPAGDLADWQATAADLPLRLQHHVAIAYEDALYVIGGDTGFFEGSTVSDRIFRAVPTENGDITEWVEVGQLPVPLTIHAATLIGNQLYVIGGNQTFQPGTTVGDTVFTAGITEAGKVEDFASLTAFPTAIGWLTAIALDQHIFGFSGRTRFSPRQLTETVWAADVQDDRSLSAFEPVSAVTPRQRHTTVLVNRTVVVIAGGGEEQVLTSVEAADIDSQGNLEPWRNLPALPEPRYAHAAFVYQDDIYVSGGFIRYGSNETSPDIFRLPAAAGSD
ncbi:MAG: 4-oxalocrotonate tautomerase [Cyanobacteria bacterium P01_C01_bin.120]